MEEVEGFVKTIAPFSLLSDETIRDVASHMKIEFFPKSTIILKRDKSKSEYFYIIYKGKIRLSRGIVGENERLVSFLGKSDYFGELSILSGGEAFFNAVVEDDSLCYILPKAYFIELHQRESSVADHFNRTFSTIANKALQIKRQELSAKRIMEDTFFLSQPTIHIARRSPVVASVRASIQECVDVMTVERVGALIITDQREQPLGIVTDGDLRKKVLFKGLSTSDSVSKIMTSPVVIASEKATLLETMLVMAHDNISHICLVNDKNKVTGVVSDKDFLRMQGTSPIAIMKRVNRQANIEGLLLLKTQMNKTIDILVGLNVDVQIVSEIIAAFNDKLTSRMIILAEEKLAFQGLGHPPVSYGWLSFGSEGRKEQAITTDQDNGIVFEDVPKKDMQEIQQYFIKLASIVVGYLEECGFERCKGNIMAVNPELCQPLSSWKKKFERWLNLFTPQDILSASIFFDFRIIYGNKAFEDDLWKSLYEQLASKKRFFFFMTQNALTVKPPLGFFGSFLVEVSGEHKGAFNLKERAFRPLVDIARIGALSLHRKETNTWKRFSIMNQNHMFPKEIIDNAMEAYSFVMGLRFTRHRLDRGSGKNPTNFINPNTLSSMSRTALKEVFHVISELQTEAKYKFGDGMEVNVTI